MKNQRGNCENGFCPECNAFSKGSIVQCSTRRDYIVPWTMVTRLYICSSCNTKIPAHIWEDIHASKAKLIQDWQQNFRHGKDLLTYARETKNTQLLNEIINICNRELSEPSFRKDQPKYCLAKSQCLISLGKKVEAKDCALKGISYAIDNPNPELVINYIALCLDTGDGEAALSALNKYAMLLNDQNLEFLKIKVDKALNKGIIKQKDITKIRLFDQYSKSTVISESENIQYVDENGNPIDASDIDTENMEFTDEWGRPVDASGELLDVEIPAEEVILIAEKMIEAGKFKDLIAHCKQYLDQPYYSKNSKLWYILGFAYANKGNILNARESFLKSILNNLPVIDSEVFANYITSCFDLSDKESALEMIEKYFDAIDLEGKGIVLESLHEAIRTKLVSASDFSVKLRKILNLHDN